MSFKIGDRVVWTPCNHMGVERGTLGTVTFVSLNEPGMIRVEWDEDEYANSEYWAFDHELEEADDE